MLNRIVQGITQLLRNRRTSTRNGDSNHSTEPKPTRDAMGGEAEKQTNRSAPVSAAPLADSRRNGNGPSHRWDRNEPGYHQNSRLLRDGRLQIGITGFNDTAFTVKILARHDSPELAAAIADLPCRAKMVAERNLVAGLEKALAMLDDRDPGRKSIVLITSGDSSTQHASLQDLAEQAVARRIGIHVICFGSKPGDGVGEPRISTKSRLGYGGFHWADTQAQLSAAIRSSVEGLLPAFGMRGRNRVVILLDCSETMVESYQGTTRIEMVISSIQEFLNAPFGRNEPVTEKYNCRHNVRAGRNTHLQPRFSSPSFSRDGAYDWAPGSAS